jgi:hypothetical protein
MIKSCTMRIFTLKLPLFIWVVIFASACIRHETPVKASKRFEPTDSDSLLLSGAFRSSSRHDA